MASSSSSSSSSSSPALQVAKTYDVFISFRGSDVRDDFLSHLHEALCRNEIGTFVDENLERGEEISKSLLEKIEDSYTSIIIFSENYAYSKWCLEELVKIVECKSTLGMSVIPVFYRVDPSHVQKLTGSYGDALAQHSRRFDESLVELWAQCLKEAASLPRLVSQNIKLESKLNEEIIKQVIEKLNILFPIASHSILNDGLVGIDSRVEEVMSLLRKPDEEFCIVGIWGEGGIGKTTLAQATFDRIHDQFNSQCFVQDVREKSEKLTADAVRNEVVSKLFGTTNSDMTRKRLTHKKVILVLDDVSNLDQIKSIMRYKDDVGYGSRIMVTSRDSHLLEYLGAKIYAVKKLNDHEALQLFCLKAFKEKVPQQGYSELSEKAVKYAQGLPLALEVLGCNLFQRCTEEWEDELEKLKGASDKKIHQILRISYDGLFDDQKEIFLDIACCFKGRHRHDVERMIDAPGSKIAISRLVEKALITIYGNWINMHDLIAQMAKDIICEEKAPEKRTWLWDPEEIYFLLSREMGTEAVRGISLDLSKIRNINLSPEAFLKMYNLKYLNFYTSSTNTRVCAPQGLQYLPEKLRYLCWSRYPSKSLPLTSFWVEKLVELDMCHSQLEKLWDGVQDLPNLKKIDLSWSEKLSEVPDLSKAPNLRSLTLWSCVSLVQIPSSITCLRNLTELRLQYCSNLKSLPDDICNLKSLTLLDVSSCEKLRELPQNFGNLESLSIFDAYDSGVEVLPESFCNLKSCTSIDVSGCVNLQRLPLDIGNLESLEYLSAGRNVITEVTPSINNLRELTDLSFSGCKDLILPPLTGDFPFLTKIDLSDCSFQEFPDNVCSVVSLTYLCIGGNNFESIPESIQQLSNLRILILDSCENLEVLPESIRHLLNLEKLVLFYCWQLQYLPEDINSLPHLRHLDLRECASLDMGQCYEIMDCRIDALVEEWRKGISWTWFGQCTMLWYPGSEIPDIMIHTSYLESCLSFSFELLQYDDEDGISFYTCVVFGKRTYDCNDITCKGNFTDKSGLNFCVEGKQNSYGVENFPVRGKHVLIKPYQFVSKNFVVGAEYEVEIKFDGSRRGTEFDQEDEDFLPSNGIIECGLLPLFPHRTADKYYFTDRL